MSKKGDRGPQSPEAIVIGLCVKIIDTFNADRVTPTTHADTFLAAQKNLKEEDEVFIRQVFYGTERYKEFTACTLASLYHMRAGKTSRNDGTLYSIFIYLTVIRLAQDLPFPQYRQLVLSQDQTKLMVLLTFLFDAEIMRGVLREVWSTQFDHTYVDEQLLGGMRRQRAQMDELLSYLTAAVTGSLEGTMLAGTARPSTGDDDEEDANGGGDAGDADAAALMARPKKFTVPTPFNLTVPRAPVLPEPEPILNRPAPAKPMPDFSAQPSLADIEAAKERRKEEYRVLAEKKFREAAAPEIHSLKRPQHLERARAQVEAELAEKMRPLSPAKPPPALPNVAPVRLNAAAILREDALYKRKMEKEAQIIRAFESELRDDKEYYEWREAEEKIEDEKKAIRVKQLKEEMVASAEAARQAVARQLAENIAVAEKMKEETAVQLVQVEKEKKAEIAEKAIAAKELKRELIDAWEKKKVEMEREAKANVEHAKAISEANAKRVAAEKEEIRQRKRELIRQIQAMEMEAAARSQKPKEFDPTTAKDIGRLCEMSLVELHERVEIMKSEKVELEQRRREKIVEAKVEKEAQLLQKLRNISRLRAQAGSDAVKRRAETVVAHKQEKTAAALKLEDQALVAQEKMAAVKKSNRDEALRLAAELKRINLERQFLNADKDKQEEKKYADLAKGIDRTTREKQTVVVAAARLAETVAADQRKLTLLNAYKEHKTKTEFRADYDVRLEQLRTMKIEDEQVDEVIKKERALALYAYAGQSSTVLKTRNPYAERANEKKKAEAAAIRARREGTLGGGSLSASVAAAMHGFEPLSAESTLARSGGGARAHSGGAH